MYSCIVIFSFYANKTKQLKMEEAPEKGREIKITGINNKYQMKKVTESKKEPKQRKVVEKWNLSSEHGNIYDVNTQLNQLTAHEAKPDFFVVMKQEVERKIQGYKQQDIDKNRLDVAAFITFDSVERLLVESGLSCYYCKNEMYILYEHVRETSQWTLDRIDNNLGHNVGNVVACCLKCNLKRRRTDADKFLFTKQLNIHKV